MWESVNFFWLISHPGLLYSPASLVYNNWRNPLTRGKLYSFRGKKSYLICNVSASLMHCADLTFSRLICGRTDTWVNAWHYNLQTHYIEHICSTNNQAQLRWRQEVSRCRWDIKDALWNFAEISFLFSEFLMSGWIRWEADFRRLILCTTSHHITVNSRLTLALYVQIQQLWWYW